VNQAAKAVPVRKSDERKFRSRLLLFGGGLFCVSAVFLEDARGRKFPQLVTDHVFRDEHGIENLAVVD
jgi:hypothetical protein